jgi:S-DNA-T family DNA segregation ATPase FtsK/SpoIIIE
LPPGTSIPERVHGAFVDDHEVHQVVNFLKKYAQPNYLEEITRGIPEDDDDSSNLSDPSDGEQDALYDQAVQIVTESQRASISGVQRRLKIGYNRAARIVEAMEAAGVVSSMQGNGSREVLAPKPRGDY